ncbi:MAG: hypothetical protein KKB21_00030 [Nanoarchaeota archaeon]|nr:hypothetical protein [Nanoarchaeota archaeon]MBU4085947.1 hypothetical protein [Nanoarchaeota archaeon]
MTYQIICTEECQFYKNGCSYLSWLNTASSPEQISSTQPCLHPETHKTLTVRKNLRTRKLEIDTIYAE